MVVIWSSEIVRNEFSASGLRYAMREKTQIIIHTR